VVENSEVCAQGAFFEFFQGVDIGGDRGTRPGLSSSIVLVGGALRPLFGDFSLYGCCKTFSTFIK
jgi:hypothetical protein